MDFSDWKPGNWCWLPPLPPGRTSGDSSRVTPKAEGNTNADPRKTPEEAVPKVEGVPHGHANASLSSTPPPRKPRTKTEHTKNEEDSKEAKAKCTKKEEVEDDTHRDQSVPAETVKSEYGLATSPVPSRGTRCNVKHERPKEEDDPPDALAAGEGRRDYSGWTTGSWCWLPPIPTAVASDSNSNSNSNSDSKPLAAGVATVGPRCKVECATRPNQEEDPNDDLAAATDEDRSAWRAGSWSWLPDEADAVPVSAAPRGTFPAGARRKRARDYDDYDDDDDDYDDDNQEFDSDRRHLVPSPPTETMARNKRVKPSHRCSSRIGRAKRDPEDDESVSDESSKFEFEFEDDDESAHGFDDDDDGFDETDDYDDDDDDPSIRDGASEFSEGDSPSVDGDADSDDATSTDVPHASEEPNGEKSRRDAAWETKFQQLAKYKKQHGTTKVLSNDRSLLRWMCEQRSKKKAGKLSEKKAARLESIGFEWNPCSSTWEIMYMRLVEYKKKYKNTNVPRKYKKDPQLGPWVQTQRYHCKRKERIDRLNRIGFVWNRRMEIEKQWNMMYQRLVEYKKEHNTTRVPSDYKADPKLGIWVQTQRKNCVRKDRVQRLNEIGFSWVAGATRCHDESWEKMYQRLVEYKKKHNTTLVPRHYKSDPKFGNWVGRQRCERPRKDRVKRLNDIGFVWNARAEYENQWHVMYQRFVEYKKKHNTTRVPYRYKGDPKLGNWVRKQRSSCHRKDRLKLLNDIGFIWNERAEKESRWDVMYQRLVEYNKKHNTTRVPYDYKADPKLGKWVSNQRYYCHRKDRIDRLDAIGFIWKAGAEIWNDQWDVMYQRLVEYNKKHNTTRVPKEYEANPKLGRWVSKQRYDCHRKDRIDRLDAIGFVWDARNP